MQTVIIQVVKLDRCSAQEFLLKWKWKNNCCLSSQLSTFFYMWNRPLHECIHDYKYFWTNIASIGSQVKSMQNRPLDRSLPKQFTHASINKTKLTSLQTWIFQVCVGMKRVRQKKYYTICSRIYMLLQTFESLFFFKMVYTRKALPFSVKYNCCISVVDFSNFNIDICNISNIV